jgi:hypothetical protein
MSILKRPITLLMALSVAAYSISFALPTFSTEAAPRHVDEYIGLEAFYLSLLPTVNQSALENGSIPPIMIWLANPLWLMGVTSYLTNRKGLMLACGCASFGLAMTVFGTGGFIGYYVWTSSMLFLVIAAVMYRRGASTHAT